uniref:Uncharacterized protein n=1 Tax=Oryza glumipatula TaxID=40148 RepID=A0A0D9YLM9_9ORYZ
MPSLLRLRLRPSAVLRTLSAPPYSSSATHSSKKVNEPLDMKNIDLALDKTIADLSEGGNASVSRRGALLI